MRNYAIQIIGQDLALAPSHFAQDWVLRHLAGLKALRIYVELRVRGHGTVDSFYTAFRETFNGHPDAVNSAMEVFEASDFYGRCLRSVLAEIPADELAKEWAARAEEFTVMSRQHAMSINLNLPANADEVFGKWSADYSAMPFEYEQHHRTRDEEAMASLAQEQAREHRRESREHARQTGGDFVAMSDKRNETNLWQQAPRDLRNDTGHGTVVNDQGVAVVY
ncbi:hypothetical protein [Cupriavidus pauculus]|uniref:Uncharacterized protein n=1 Tax=Cupriavidus pauculus TaxID=82633 RepID=A0A2N5C9I6_9BURK|nr:hypothetical protein [Cupriavidus pauculus]PLP98888.1 hypothetical protein CYJ10_19055 [Cupriavidus pauculus]